MDELKVLIAAQMIMQSFPSRTIDFFTCIYTDILQNQYVTCADMAEMYGCTPQAARKHVAVLTARGYLRRLHYRAWQINADPIRRLVVMANGIQKFKHDQER